MIEGFETISDEQFIKCKEAIAWITLLIAGSDGEIDSTETEWAKKLAKIRSYSNPNVLTPFYQEVGSDFSEVLSKLIDSAPVDSSARTKMLFDKISQLNDILPLLDDKISFRLYESYKSFALHVAKSHGGFLGFFTVSREEKKLVELPMLREIRYVDEEE